MTITKEFLFKLLEAAEQGRVLILPFTPPCVGGWVYRLVGKQVEACLVWNVNMNTLQWSAHAICGDKVVFSAVDIGKSIFLKKEDAEKAREESDNESM